MALKVLKLREKKISVWHCTQSYPVHYLTSYLKLSLPTSRAKTGLAEPRTEFQPLLVPFCENSIQKDYEVVERVFPSP